MPRIGGTVSGVTIRRMIVYWGLYWGSHYFEKLEGDRPVLAGKRIVMLGSWCQKQLRSDSERQGNPAVSV